MISKDSAELRTLAGQIAAAGGLIAFRTDTFYGLGVNPFDEKAVRKLKQLKGRDGGKPILLLISSLKQLDLLLESRTETFKSLSEKLWPGPLTIVARSSNLLPNVITAGTKTVGVRLPDDANVRELVQDCGGVLTATSANVAGKPPARSAQEVLDYFPAGIDLIIDGGKVTATLASTVLDSTTDAPVMIREGAISKAQIEAVLQKQLRV